MFLFEISSYILSLSQREAFVSNMTLEEQEYCFHKALRGNNAQTIFLLLSMNCVVPKRWMAYIFSQVKEVCNKTFIASRTRWFWLRDSHKCLNYFIFCLHACYKELKHQVFKYLCIQHLKFTSNFNSHKFLLCLGREPYIKLGEWPLIFNPETNLSGYRTSLLL